MKKKLLAVICILTLCVTTILSGCSKQSGAEDSGDTVKVACQNGVMVGKTIDGINEFKGIPYAQQPVGELRWKAPQAPEQSDEEIECFDFGHTAIQYEWPSEPASYTAKGEDCLSLNIWANQEGGDEPKPVMVFFHGGAYGWGGTADPMYDGENLVKAHGDVIVVTCNYRLGLMSWADFSDYGAEYNDINLGIRDQIASLEWIKNNIEGFGGDPNNVTIFGESAGAWSTTALLISPPARGLFKRVIAESGVVPIKDRDEAKEFASVIMDAAGTDNMDDLMKISAEEWMELDSTEWITDESCGVVEDGEIIPFEADIEKNMRNSIEDGVQLLLGTNMDEWNYFQEDMEGDTEAERFNTWVDGMNDMWDEAYEDADKDGKKALDELMDYELENVAERFAEFIEADKAEADDEDEDAVQKETSVQEALAKSAFVTETWRYEHTVFADRYALNGGDVRMYLWNVPSTKPEMYKSAVHAVELAYVFNNLNQDIYAGEVDEASAERVQNAWINFAKTGDPSIEGAEWTRYNTYDRNTMVMEKDGWKMVSDPSKKAREYLTRAYGYKPYQVW